MFTQEMMQLVEQSLLKTCNAYAEKGEMNKAVAIDDAHRCLEVAMKKFNAENGDAK